MKSLKQDLVGFHWSAFFEPRLPFTRVPVKLPLPHLLPPSLSLFFLSLCLALSPFPTLLLPSCLSAHLPTLQCTYCQLAMVIPISPYSFFTSSSLPRDLWPRLLTSVFRYILSPCRLDCCGPLSNSSFFLHTPASSPTLPQTLITKSIPLSICKTLRGPFFPLFPYFFLGEWGAIRWRDFYALHPFLFCFPYNSHL